MQTLRKKTSPLKYKNETTRFLGDGVSFKAKLIGILEVSEARGDRMCQEALSDLKMAIRAAGEHKQRITINVAIDGLRLRDEKTGDSLYHHPVHKISFIAQDMTDSRAFGYIFGSPDTGHRFFGIKTDKAASQVVIAMRDLFQVVFALKKKEIELAKQHLDKGRFSGSPLFSDGSISSSKSVTQDPIKPPTTETKTDTKSGGTAVADLVDLELELNSLQQGLNQMERITPSDPFVSKDDPFGDSFTTYNKPMLPPPPSSGRDRSTRLSETSTGSGPRTPHAGDVFHGPKARTEFGFADDFDISTSSAGDWFATTASFEERPLVPEPVRDDKHETAKKEIMSQFDVFTELDPLGTGRSKPYIDKKHFFQELKNPPKKVLNDLVPRTIQTTNTTTTTTDVPLFPTTLNKPSMTSGSGDFSTDPFGEDPFVSTDPFADNDFVRHDPFGIDAKPPMLGTSPKIFQFSTTGHDLQFRKLHDHGASLDQSSDASECAPEPPPRPVSTLTATKPPPLPPKKQIDLTIKPPPRPPHDDPHYDYLETSGGSGPLNSVDESPPLPVPVRKVRGEADFTPERPAKRRDDDEDEDGYLTPIGGDKMSVLLPPPSQKSSSKRTVGSLFESRTDASPTQIDSLEGLDITLSQLTLSGLNELAQKLNIPASQLSNMTLVQLTSYLSNFVRKTPSPRVDDQPLRSFRVDTPTFKADFAANFNDLTTTKTSETYDRYAVFRELIKEEIKQTKIDSEPEEFREEQQQKEQLVVEESIIENNSSSDRYAALREIVENELKLNSIEATENDKNVAEREVEVIQSSKYEVIEYNGRSPELNEHISSPLPDIQETATENTVRPASGGSLSEDVVTGSSPEIDNEQKEKPTTEIGESWAIFDTIVPEDTPKVVPEPEIKPQSAVQSEEGVSPWSSDSKEYGNGSSPPPPPPPTTNVDWRTQRRRPGDTDHQRWSGRRSRRRGGGDSDGWWDTSAEPETPQYFPSNRRSTDSYDEEFYECYDRPRRRTRQYGSTATGGHSSSSRDVSPWEEEPTMRRSGRSGWTGRHPPRTRRPTDSWDDDEEEEEEEEEEEDEEEQYQRGSGRYHRREGYGGRDYGEWSDDKRHRRKGCERDRWCCPDWEKEDSSPRYASRHGHALAPNESMNWRFKYDDQRYYGRSESPWDDDYSNDADDTPPPPPPPPHYATTKRSVPSWKRPSSAGEAVTSRHPTTTTPVGGSDGERDLRRLHHHHHKAPGRRSKSRDSHSDAATLPLHRLKPQDRSRKDLGVTETKKSEIKTDIGKRLGGSLRKKDSKREMLQTRTRSFFETDFLGSKESGSKFEFEKETRKPRFDEGLKVKTTKEGRISPRYGSIGKAKSLFEDDFSPTEKNEPDDTISSIKEENESKAEQDDSFDSNLEDMARTSKKLARHNKLANSSHLKKSESVNIFSREHDPFDDDFFSEKLEENEENGTNSQNTQLRWTDDFDDFSIDERK